jgi:hypothetical protein
MNLPNPTTNDNRASAWMRRLQQGVRANQLTSSGRVKVRRGTLGLSLDVPGSGGPISTWRFKEMSTDYIICRSWDGTTEGSTDVKIAKAPELRFSITSEVIDGDTVNYDGYDLDAQTRNASDGTTTETQVIVPRYLPDVTIIFACRANSLGKDDDDNPIGLLDLNVAGRAWAKTESTD